MIRLRDVLLVLGFVIASWSVIGLLMWSVAGWIL